MVSAHSGREDELTVLHRSGNAFDAMSSNRQFPDLVGVGLGKGNADGSAAVTNEVGQAAPAQ